MRPMRHGYTNDTRGDAAHVEKVYQGPDAADRGERERVSLELLGGLLPVPAVRESGPGFVRLELLPGEHGQDLIAQGHAGPVLRSAGMLLGRLHSLKLDQFDQLDQGGRSGAGSGAGTSAGSGSVSGAGTSAAAGAGAVLVHGDFGPNNILFDPADFTATALLDWEFAHVGRPVEDLAWCEWIIRTHHPEERDALEEFFAGYGRPVPAWSERQDAMLERCRYFEEFCHRWESDGGGVRQWAERAAATEAWHE